MFKFLHNIATRAGNFYRQHVSPFLRKLSTIPAIGATLLSDYPPAVKAYLEKHGDTEITSIKVFRHPINSFINQFDDYATFGKWSVLQKKYGFDKFFHVGLRLNDSIQLEREQTMKIGAVRPKKEDEFFPVTMYKPIKLRDLIDKAVKHAGPSFFRYNAFNNNCQRFTIEILQANGLLTPAAERFINQSVEKLLKDLPSYVEPIAQTATDLGGVVDTLRQHFND